jgi:hypothetical protein
MIASFLNELIATVVQALPRIFLVGAPVLVVGIILAAIVDARLPARTDRSSQR